jgi:hypothetical protein
MIVPLEKKNMKKGKKLRKDGDWVYVDNRIT